MMELYQFPISHYCEKARWALDHKGLSYSVKNLIPGPHIKQVKKISRLSEVPVLKDRDEVIQGSDHIIDYLDELYPESSLTPESSSQKIEVKEWEEYSSKYLGIPIRSLIYAEIIDKPDLVIPLWTKFGPWYGSLFYKLFYSKVQKALIKGMKLDKETSNKSKALIEKAFAELNKELANKPFLVGDCITRADISLCALMSPFVSPKTSFMKHYASHPDNINIYREQFVDQPLFKWVEKIYEQYR